MGVKICVVFYLTKSAAGGIIVNFAARQGSRPAEINLRVAQKILPVKNLLKYQNHQFL